MSDTLRKKKQIHAGIKLDAYFIRKIKLADV
jgi:hypothetical protein